MYADLLIFIRAVIPHIAFNSDVTENLFDYVRSNAGVLNWFNNLCQQYGQRAVKQGIGRLIRTTYSLPNTGRGKSKTGLIRTYTKH